jgi:hypothetical protein
MELVGQHFRIAEPGAQAEIDQAIALRGLIVLHAARRQLDRGIGERTAAVAGTVTPAARALTVIR